MRASKENLGTSPNFHNRCVTDTKFGARHTSTSRIRNAGITPCIHALRGSKERVVRCGALIGRHGDRFVCVCNSHTHARPAFGDTPCDTPTCDASLRREQCSTYGTSTWTWCRSLAHGAHCAWHGAWQHIHCSIDRAERVQLAVEVARRQRTWRVPKRSAGELRLHVCRERRADHGVRWRCGWGGVVPL